MDMREANLAFHYAEKLKSNLFLLSGALDIFESFKGERQEGAREVVKGMLSGVRRELSISQGYFPQEKADLVSEQLDAIERDVESSEYDSVRERLGVVISQVTTVCSEHIKVLMEQGLV